MISQCIDAVLATRDPSVGDVRRSLLVLGIRSRHACRRRCKNSCTLLDAYQVAARPYRATVVNPPLFGQPPMERRAAVRPVTEGAMESPGQEDYQPA